MHQQLSGKTALVTGGTSGIGLAIAEAFIAEGAHVFITGRRTAQLDDAKAQLGDHVTTIQGDVGQLDDLDRIYAVIRAAGRPLDIVVANAGGGSFAPLGQITEAHFDQTFDTNVKGTLFTVQKALPLLNDGASVILMASTTSITGTPAFSVYSATKAAVRSFARTWALDLKDRHIRVNAVSPGPTLTPGLTDLAPDAEQAQALLDGLTSGVPLGRMGQPEEIAQAVVFLASDRSSFITGTELFVDGGTAQV
ncbi:glucose 1-dehydrogenase [Deinococcus sonorensis]|uniref:Glucose 1-dehydrogenase n=2 Tax=Deinococcus sonorensis TaxID=309891 RepID=A0AAU7U6V2_9DEIO